MSERWVVTFVVAFFAIIVGAAFVVGQTANSAVPAVPTSNAAPLLYATFSGEAGRSNVETPITTVIGITPDGAVNENVLPGSQSFDELRGMALDATGRFYLVQANKKATAIFRYQQTPTGQLTNQSTFVDQAQVPSLVHPYAVQIDPAGNVLTSVQDTFTVQRFTPAGIPAPVATSLRASFPLISFYPGTFAASAIPSLGPAPSPTVVPLASGGLEGPRGLAVSAARNRIYVADDYSHRVLSYDLSTGQFMGAVFSDPQARPVGLAFDPNTLALLITAEDTNVVYSVNVDRCDSGCPSTVAIPTSSNGVSLDAPAGVAVAQVGDQTVAYVASREGNQINKYELTDGQVTAASVLINNLSDMPEQLILAQRSAEVVK